MVYRIVVAVGVILRRSSALTIVLARSKNLSRDVHRTFIQLIAPFMPHLGEELWAIADYQESVFASPWPEFDPKLYQAEMITIGVTVNGKRRGEVTMPSGADEAAVIAAGKAVPAVQRQLDGKEIVREIVVPDRVLNFVVR